MAPAGSSSSTSFSKTLLLCSVLIFLFFVSACAPVQTVTSLPTITTTVATFQAPLPLPTPTVKPTEAPDYSLVYFEENQLYLFDPVHKTSRAITQAAEFLTKDSSAAYLAASPNGKEILFDGYDVQIGCPTFRGTNECWLTGPNGFFTANLETGIAEMVAPYTISNMDWSPDSQYMVFAQLIYDTTLFQSKLMVKPAAGGESTQITDGNWVDQFPSWSPDGQWIAFLRYTPPPPGGPKCTHAVGFYDECYDPSLYIVHPDGSGLTRILRHLRMVQTDYNQPSWSPDGKSIAVITGTSPAELTLVDVESRKTTVLPGLVPSSNLPVWSPDGRMLAVTSQMNGSQQVILISKDGKPIRILSENVERATVPSWSPDGKWVAFLGGKVGEKLHLMIASANGDVVLDFSMIHPRSRTIFLPSNH